MRNIRRRAREVSGTIAFSDGRVETIDELTPLGASEAALRVLTVSVVALAAALVVLRLG